VRLVERWFSAPGFPASIECYKTYMSVATRIAIQKVQFLSSTNALSVG
jgi:hypothetical protein